MVKIPEVTAESWEQTCRAYATNDAEADHAFFAGILNAAEMTELEQRVRAAMSERPDIPLTAHMFDNALAIRRGTSTIAELAAVAAGGAVAQP